MASLKETKNYNVCCQDCGHKRFVFIGSQLDMITACMKCGFKYQLREVYRSVPMLVVDPMSSVVPYTVPRGFVTRYVTRQVKRWVPLKTSEVH